MFINTERQPFLFMLIEIQNEEVLFAIKAISNNEKANSKKSNLNNTRKSANGSKYFSRQSPMSNISIDNIILMTFEKIPHASIFYTLLNKNKLLSNKPTPHRSFLFHFPFIKIIPPAICILKIGKHSNMAYFCYMSKKYFSHKSIKKVSILKNERSSFDLHQSTALTKSRQSFKSRFWLLIYSSLQSFKVRIRK